MLRSLLCLDGFFWIAVSSTCLRAIPLRVWISKERESNMLKILTRAFFPFQLSVFQDSEEYICNLSLPYNYHLPVSQWRNFFSKSNEYKCLLWLQHALLNPSDNPTNAYQLTLSKVLASSLTYLLTCLYQVCNWNNLQPIMTLTLYC